MSSVPNETVDAIRQVYYLAVSSWVGAVPYQNLFQSSILYGHGKPI